MSQTHRLWLTSQRPNDPNNNHWFRLLGSFCLLTPNRIFERGAIPLPRCFLLLLHVTVLNCSAKSSVTNKIGWRWSSTQFYAIQQIRVWSQGVDLRVRNEDLGMCLDPPQNYLVSPGHRGRDIGHKRAPLYPLLDTSRRLCPEINLGLCP